VFECPVCHTARPERDHSWIDTHPLGVVMVRDAPLRWRLSMVGAAIVALATSCAQVPSTPVAGTPTPSVSIEPIVGALAPVVDGQRDFLEPAPSSLSPKLSLQEVLTRLRADPSTAEFVRYQPGLVVHFGLYSNPGLATVDGLPTSRILSYVFSGGLGACPPAIGRPGIPGPEASANPICAATLIVDANDGHGQLESTRPTGS